MAVNARNHPIIDRAIANLHLLLNGQYDQLIIDQGDPFQNEALEQLNHQLNIRQRNIFAAGSSIIKILNDIALKEMDNPQQPINQRPAYIRRFKEEATNERLTAIHAIIKNIFGPENN